MEPHPSLAPLILASASPRRAELLSELGVIFTVEATDVPELDDATGSAFTPAELVLANASRKATKAFAKRPDAKILAADTEVSLDGRIYGKPRNLQEARRMLASLSGRTHEVWTGVVYRTSSELRADAICSWVTFRKLRADDIEKYIHLVNTLDKAGAYAVQEHAEVIIRKIEGSRSNVMGLPLELVRQWLLTT